MVYGTKNLLLVVLVASRKPYLALASMKNTCLPSNTETAKTAAQTGNREASTAGHPASNQNNQRAFWCSPLAAADFSQLSKNHFPCDQMLLMYPKDFMDLLHHDTFTVVVLAQFAFFYRTHI